MSEKLEKAIPELAEKLETVVRELREQLGERDISQMNLIIDISGRTMSGDLIVEYRLSDSSYGATTKGGLLQNVYVEFLRRHGWEHQNNVLALPRVAEPKPEEEA